jgi:hypothetical protein
MYRLILLTALGSFLVGCMSGKSSNMTLNRDGERKIVIKYPTGDYQASHNIFFPYQEVVEIYTIILPSQGDFVDARNITVYKFSDLSRLELKGSIKIFCENSEYHADIKLYYSTDIKFELNGEYDLNTNCL